MPIIIDVIIIALSCATVYFASRQGFVRIFVRILGYILALLIATAISKPVAGAVFSSFVEPKAVTSINETISKNVNSHKNVGSAADAVDSVYDSMPDFMASYLDSYGFDRDKIASSLDGLSAGDYTELSKGIVDSLIKPLITNLLELIIFLIILSILMVVVGVVSRSLRGVRRIPIIGPLNSFLGGALGVLKAALIIYIIAACVKIFIVCTGNANGVINESVVGSTYIFNIFYKYNLFSS